MTTPNVIPDRIADALRRFPPFSMLESADVRGLAAEARVRAVAEGEILWSEGDAPCGDVFFLARGRVEYFWNPEGEGEELVDVRDVGDLLGLTAEIASNPYKVEARVVEDSLLYVLSIESLKRLLDRHDEARHYVRRHLFWATRVGGKISVPAKDDYLENKRTILQAHLDGAQVIRPRPPGRLLTCRADDTLRDAGSLMVSKRVPSILVIDDEGRPLGMVTSVNLVKHVVVQGGDPATPVSELMASPVYTVAPQSSATAAILLMLRERVPQVCVTTDGTPETRALDVCTHKDLLAQSGQHPAGLLREIRFARSAARLRELCDEIERIARGYVEAGVSGVFLGQICAELYDELLQRLADFAIDSLNEEGLRLPKVDWAWLSVGSDGRREQVLRTDMDNALVFASSATPQQDEAHRRIFLRFAELVVEGLVTCGFSRCQGGVMALNPRWCRTEAEWKAEIENPDSPEPDALLRACVLYDLRFVVGSKAIAARLREQVFAKVGIHRFALSQLAEMVVATPPPLNFWGKFTVERKGGAAGRFDLKSRGLAPLRDAARVLALKHNLTRHYSTGGRFRQLGEALPRYVELCGLAGEAYDFLMRLRILNGLKRGDSGRYIDPGELTKLERAQLTNVFDVVRMVQTAVRAEFNLELRSR
jgi:CBS domain-containing protein